MKIKTQTETMLIQNQTNQPIEVHHASDLRVILTQSQDPCWSLLYRHIQERKYGRTYLSVFQLHTSYLSADMMNFIRACIDEGISVCIDTPQGNLSCDDYLSYDYTGYAPVYLKLNQLQRELASAQQELSQKQFDYSYLSQMRQSLKLKHTEDYLIRKLKRYCKILDIEFEDIAQAVTRVYDLSIKPSTQQNTYTEQMETLQGLWYLDNCIRPPRKEHFETASIPAHWL